MMPSAGAPKERCMASSYEHTEKTVRQDGRTEEDGLLQLHGRDWQCRQALDQR